MRSRPLCSRRPAASPGPDSGPAASSQSPARVVALALALALMAATVLSRLWALGAGMIDFDEGVYWLSLHAMQAGHPLYSSVYDSQPPGLLLLSGGPWALLGASITAARALMLAWGVVGVGAGAVAGWRLGGAVASVSVAALLVIEPMMVRQSVVLQPDGPATSLALVAFALAAIAVTTRRPRAALVAALLSGIALALGELTKLFDVAALPPLLALLALARAGRLRLVLAAALGGLVGAAALLLPVAGAWPEMWSQAIGEHVGNTQGQGFPLLSVFLHNQSLAFAGLAALGVLFGWVRQPRLAATGLLWCLGALVTLAAIRPLWPHHGVIAAPGFVLLGASALCTAYAWIADHLPSPRAVAALASALAVAGAGAGAVYFLSRDVNETNVAQSGIPPLATLGPGEAPVVAALESHAPAGAYVVSDDPFYQAAAARWAPPALVDMSLTRLDGAGTTIAGIEAGILDAHVCAVLVSPKRLATVPGFPAWARAHYPETIAIPGGRTLHVRPGCG